MVVLVCLVIFSKKSIYYDYVDKSKKITLFDYFTDYDGDWLFRSINYDKIVAMNPDNKELINKICSIKKQERIILYLFVFFIFTLAMLKIFDL